MRLRCLRLMRVIGSVIHCDLKPSNFLIGEDGVLKFVDFGFVHCA